MELLILNRGDQLVQFVRQIGVEFGHFFVKRLVGTKQLPLNIPQPVVPHLNKIRLDE